MCMYTRMSMHKSIHVQVRTHVCTYECTAVWSSVRLTLKPSAVFVTFMYD